MIYERTTVFERGFSLDTGPPALALLHHRRGGGCLYDNGATLFNRVRYRHHDEAVFLYAFDLIELSGDDLRRYPLEGRKATLEMILAKAGPGIQFNEHMEGDGETVFRHPCKLGLEGIVSKRKDSAYRSGRSPDWLARPAEVAQATART